MRDGDSLNSTLNTVCSWEYSQGLKKDSGLTYQDFCWRHSELTRLHLVDGRGKKHSQIFRMIRYELWEFWLNSLIRILAKSGQFREEHQCLKSSPVGKASSGKYEQFGQWENLTSLDRDWWMKWNNNDLPQAAKLVMGSNLLSHLSLIYRHFY